MTRDLIESSNRKPPGPGRLVVTGVVGACVLGVTLGVWARPGDPGAKAAPKPTAKAEAPLSALRIVVAETPAPLRDRMEVLPAEVRMTPSTPLNVVPAQPEPPELTAPRRATSGLMKVDAEVPAEPPAPTPMVQVTPRKAEPTQPPRAVVANVQPELPLAEAKAAEARAVAIEKAAAERAAARRLAAQKLAQQKLAEQKFARQKLSQQRLAEQKQADRRLAEARARRDQALAEARAAKAEKARVEAQLAKAEKDPDQRRWGNELD